MVERGELGGSKQALSGQPEVNPRTFAVLKRVRPVVPSRRLREPLPRSLLIDWPRDLRQNLAELMSTSSTLFTCTAISLDESIPNTMAAKNVVTAGSRNSQDSVHKHKWRANEKSDDCNGRGGVIGDGDRELQLCR